MISIDAPIPWNHTSGLRPGREQHIQYACDAARELREFVRARYVERFGEFQRLSDQSSRLNPATRERAMWDEILDMATAADGLMRMAAEARE